MLKVYFVYSHPYDRTFCELLNTKQKEKEFISLIGWKDSKKRLIEILNADKNN